MNRVKYQQVNLQNIPVYSQLYNRLLSQLNFPPLAHQPIRVFNRRVSLHLNHLHNPQQVLQCYHLLFHLKNRLLSLVDSHQYSLLHFPPEILLHSHPETHLRNPSEIQVVSLRSNLQGFLLLFHRLNL